MDMPVYHDVVYTSRRFTMPIYLCTCLKRLLQTSSFGRLRVICGCQNHTECAHYESRSSNRLQTWRLNFITSQCCSVILVVLILTVLFPILSTRSDLVTCVPTIIIIVSHACRLAFIMGKCVHREVSCSWYQSTITLRCCGHWQSSSVSHCKGQFKSCHSRRYILNVCLLMWHVQKHCLASFKIAAAVSRRR